MQKWKKMLSTLTAVSLLAGSLFSFGTMKEVYAEEEKESVSGEVFGDNLKYDPSAEVCNGEDVTLSIWVPAAWEDYYRKWTGEYSKLHPNVSFEFTITSFDDHWKKVPLAMQSKSAPDLFWMHNSVNEIMIPHMEPLPEEKFPLEQVKNDFRQVESNIIDGNLYYVDMGLMTGVIYYNKDMWEEAGLTEADIPATWDEYREIAKKLTVTDDEGNIQVAGFNCNGAEYLWVDMMYQQGKYLFADDDATPVFDSEEALKAAQLMYDMYNTDNIGSGTQPKAEEAFANGKAATIYCWGWASNYFKSNFPDLNYGAFALPVFDDSEVIAYPVYHFDGVEQEKHLGHLLQMKKLKAIQWTHVAGQPSASHYLPILKRIQEAGKGLIIMAPAEDVPVLLENLSGKGLYLHTETEDIYAAKEIIKYVERNSRE